MSQTEDPHPLSKCELLDNTCCGQWSKVADAVIEAQNQKGVANAMIGARFSVLLFHITG